jgi:hypothetical protein
MSMKPALPFDALTLDERAELNGIRPTRTPAPAHLVDVCRFARDGHAIGHDYSKPEDYGIGYTRLRLIRCKACDQFTLWSIGTGAEVLDDLLKDAYPIESTGPCWPSIEAPGAKPNRLAPKKRGVRRRKPPKTAAAIRAEQIQQYVRRKQAPATVRELHLVLGIPEQQLYSTSLRRVASGKYGLKVSRPPGRRLQFEEAA